MFSMFVYASSFFFQAEDGIRDYKVTGVQTCALPISEPDWSGRFIVQDASAGIFVQNVGSQQPKVGDLVEVDGWTGPGWFEIGRASCRERGEVSVVAG